MLSCFLLTDAPCMKALTSHLMLEFSGFWRYRFVLCSCCAGMTGSLVLKGVKSHQYNNFKVDGSEWPPKYWKLALKLHGDVSVAFSDPRRFARIRLQEQPEQHEPISLLRFGPVLSMPSLEDFTAAVKSKKTSWKALLLDQVSSHCTGMQLVIACQACFSRFLHCKPSF